MASYTEHYNFVKPDESEYYNIADVENTNIDMVDKILFNKEDKQPGKGLSTNDFTDEYKKKLDGLNNYDDTDVKDNIASNTKSIKTIQEEQSNQNTQIEDIKSVQETQDVEIETIKQTDLSQDKEIENLKSKIVELKAENVALKSQIPDGEEEGSVIHLSDSSDLPCQIVPIGNAIQDGEPSPETPIEIKTVGQNVNLSEVNEITIESYSSNPTNVTGFIETSKLPITIQFKQSNEESYVGYIRYYDENKAYLGQIQYSNSLYVAKGLTITENMSNAKYVAYTIKGTEGTNTFPLEITKIKTEEGTKATGYSPYGQGSVEIGVCNENLFDKDAVTVGFLVPNTGNINASDDLYTSDFIQINSSKKYYLPARGSVRGKYFDKDKKLLYPSENTSSGYDDFASPSTGEVILNNIPENARYIRFSLKKEYLDNYYVVVGDKSTDYTPHEGYTESLPIQKEFVKIGDYEDTFVNVDGKWYEKHWISSDILDDNYEWILSTSYTTDEYLCAYVNMENKNIKDKGKLTICDRLKNGVYTDLTTKECIGNHYVSLNLKILASRLSEASIDGLKFWLKDNPLKVYYILYAPKLIPCTPEQEEILNSFHTYRNVTNVWCDGIGTIKVNYTQDLKTYIDNQINELATAIVNNS